MRIWKEARWIASQVRERFELLRGPLTVFMYHRVCAAQDHAFLQQAGVPFVTPQVFHQHLEFLRAREFQVLDLEEALDCIEKGQNLAPRSCVITFDDGYRDNLVHAEPALREFGYPATLFVASRVLEQDELLWEHRVLWALAHLEADEFRELAGREFEFAKAKPDAWIVLNPRGPNLDQRRQLGQRIAQCMLDRGIDEAEMARELYLAGSDLEGLQRAGIRIAPHGAEHHHLTNMSPQEKDADLAEAESSLSRHLGDRWLKVYCSPYGSHRPEDRDLLVRRGYRGAASVRFGTNSASVDPFFLRRVSLGNESWNRLRFLDRASRFSKRHRA